MNTDANDTNDILTALEAFYADADAAGGEDLDTQAELILWEWEMEGVCKILWDACERKGHNAALAYRSVRKMLFKLFCLTRDDPALDPEDKALELASKKLAAMPLDFRLQAILYHFHGRMFVKGDRAELRRLGYLADPAGGER
jgi:hypothetical protein